MIRSSDITSFTEHRQRLRDHLTQCQKTGRPLYVTTNGVTDAVVLSPEAYDELAEKADILESLKVIDRSMEDVRAGRGREMKSAVREIADNLGLKLNR